MSSGDGNSLPRVGRCPGRFRGAPPCVHRSSLWVSQAGWWHWDSGHGGDRASGPQQLEEKHFGVGWSIPLTQPPALTPVHPGGSSCCGQRGSPRLCPCCHPSAGRAFPAGSGPSPGDHGPFSLPPDPFSPLPAPLSPSLGSSTTRGFPFSPLLCVSIPFPRPNHPINPILLVLVDPSALLGKPKVFPSYSGQGFWGGFRAIWANVE